MFLKGSRLYAVYQGVNNKGGFTCAFKNYLFYFFDICRTHIIFPFYFLPQYSPQTLSDAYHLLSLIVVTYVHVHTYIPKYIKATR